MPDRAVFSVRKIDHRPIPKPQPGLVASRRQINMGFCHLRDAALRFGAPVSIPKVFSRKDNDKDHRSRRRPPAYEDNTAMAPLLLLLLDDQLQPAEKAFSDGFGGFGLRGKDQLDLFHIGCLIPFMQ